MPLSERRLPLLARKLFDLAIDLGRRELTFLLLLLGVSFAAWGFVEIADEVLEGDSHAFDERILLSMRSPASPGDPWGPEYLEEMARDITGLGGTVVLTSISLFSVAYLYLKGNKRAMIFVAASIAGGIILSTLLKQGFDRPRPDLVPHGSYVYSASFPSGHSMMAAIVYLTLGALLARVEPHWRMKIYLISIGILLTICVGLSRIYLGVHWPTDVLAGWSGGAAYATGCWLVAHLWARRKQGKSQKQF